MILFEMVHDARIIKMNGEHNDESIRDWQGDSQAVKGDTLVVKTKISQSITDSWELIVI